MRKKTLYQRIVKASEKGKGIRLSAEDCRELATDDAIPLVGRECITLRVEHGEQEVEVRKPPRIRFSNMTPDGPYQVDEIWVQKLVDIDVHWRWDGRKWVYVKDTLETPGETA